MSRVLVDSPPVPLDVVRGLLDGTEVEIDAPARPWSGDDVVGLVVWDAVGRAELERLPALRVVASCGQGYDHVDLATAAERGIWVCNVPDYCVEEVADHTLALALTLIRRLDSLREQARQGRWARVDLGSVRRSADSIWGVVGFGRIGRAVARRAAAFGFTIWASDPQLPEQQIAAHGARPSTLDDTRWTMA